MSKVQPPKDKLLARVAGHRANGFAWEWIAEEENLDVEVIQTWPRRYRRRWQRFIERAEQDLICEGSAEAVQTLRKLLRVADDDKLRRDAAQRIIQLRIATMRLQRKPNRDKKSTAGDSQSPYRRMVQYLEGLSDVELQRIAERGGAVPEQLPELAEASPTVAE